MAVEELFFMLRVWCWVAWKICPKVQIRNNFNKKNLYMNIGKMKIRLHKKALVGKV